MNKYLPEKLGALVRERLKDARIGGVNTVGDVLHVRLEPPQGGPDQFHMFN